MGIQSIDGQSAAYFPSYTARGAASGTMLEHSASVPAADPGNSVQPKAVITQTPQQHLEDATSQVQDQLKSIGVNLDFSIDRGSGKTVVKVIDPATQELIRQIPTKEMLVIAQNLDVKLKGLLISHRV